MIFEQISLKNKFFQVLRSTFKKFFLGNRAHSASVGIDDIKIEGSNIGGEKEKFCSPRTGGVSERATDGQLKSSERLKALQARRRAAIAKKKAMVPNYNELRE